MKYKADSTLRFIRAVPHPSTNRALCRLTSEVERDPVHPEQPLAMWLERVGHFGSHHFDKQHRINIRESHVSHVPAGHACRQRGDSNPCGQSPMDFQSITLAARSHCLGAHGLPNQSN